MSLTARERRLLAVGALVLVLALAWLGVVQPIINGFSERAAERELMTRGLAAGRRLIAQRPVWRARAAALVAQSGPFAPADADQAAARAADTALAAATAQGATVLSVTTEAPEAGLARARVQMRADVTQLVAALKDLESRQPYLVVQSLSVASEPAAAAQGGGLAVTIIVGAPYVAQHG